jgi:hypothetical protein
MDSFGNAIVSLEAMKKSERKRTPSSAIGCKPDRGKRSFGAVSDKFHDDITQVFADVE